MYQITDIPGSAGSRSRLGVASYLRYIPSLRRIDYVARFPSALLLAALLVAGTFSYGQNPVGIFEDHADVGMVLHAGSSTFDSAKGTYTLRGSGENMWATQDAFQFAWKKVSGDVDLTADISFSNTAGNEHKKAVLMIPAIAGYTLRLCRCGTAREWIDSVAVSS